jgi:hypothetical protein
VSEPAGIVLHLFQRNLDHFHRRSDIYVNQSKPIT